MEAQVHDLTHRRGQLKSRTTRLESYFTKLTVESNKTELGIRLARYEGTLDEFDEVQSQLEMLQGLETHKREREDFENTYFQLVAKIKDFLGTNEVQSTGSPTEALLPQSMPSTGHSIATTRIKLPVIDIPKFSGDYNGWLSFHDAFCSLIHNNQSLNNIQKFQYLRSVLAGDASRLIEFIPVSSDNYSIAWESIEERYKNPRMLIQSHVSTLLNLPNIASNSFTSLRQLVDSFHGSCESLKRLKVPVESWDAILIPLIAVKLDFATRREWENSLKTNEYPTIQEFREFLTQRCRFLENLHIYKQNDKQPHSNNSKQTVLKPQLKSVNLALKAETCSICNEKHFIYICPVFKELSPVKRLEKVKSLKLCTNCLREHHKTNQCRSSTCKTCQKRHHTLLHNSDLNPAETNSDPKTSSLTALAANHCSQSLRSQVLLSTFIVYIYDSNNKLHECRGLLDAGSQCNFLSREKCKQLGLKLKSIHLPISGVNHSHSTVTQCVNVFIKSKYTSFETRLNCLVIGQVTENLPLNSFSSSCVHVPKNIVLADPQFYHSRPVDLLLGAELFWELLCVGQIRLSKNQPIFQKTLLGWIVSGRVCNEINSKSSLCAATTGSLEKQVAQFWEIEELPGQLKSPRELEFDKYFTSTTKRDEDGRFVVHLPFKVGAGELGYSKDLAIKRFYNLERKLENEPRIKNLYIAFMREYLNLQHMELVPESQLSKSVNTFYLPHHAVLREDRVTTKLRVVFDGSFKSSNKTSLNDVLEAGPVLQQDLFNILLRFRTYQYVVCADIKQMYRQIKITPEHRDFQRIVWRESKNEDMKVYRLNTVTYGITSAPYLAIRCLHELALNEGLMFPNAQQAILRDFYVDDLLSGADTPRETIELANQINSILSKGRFELHKWSSNDRSILDALKITSNSSGEISLDKQEKRILGVGWNCDTDRLKYDIRPITHTKITKRTILSIVSQFFDPLGLLSPVIVLAKIILQQLWTLKLAWDEAVPQSVYGSWSKIIEDIRILNQLEIPRRVLPTASSQAIEIHAFCDASEVAYGTCIYLKTQGSDNQYNVELLCAKSRVAPLNRLTLPRLELCGALLLARLLHKVLQNLNLNISKIFCWTDSMIVLAWLRKPANFWKTFVGNRVAEIQTLTKQAKWLHVVSGQNPADLISRGVLPKQFLESTLWWKGPNWLSESSEFYPKNILETPTDSSILEQRQSNLVVGYVNSERFDLLHRFSSYSKLQRVMAYCLRFIFNLKFSSEKRVGCLTSSELINATNKVVHLIQRAEFQVELQELSKGLPVSRSSRLIMLSPFIDEFGLIRVGGRLKKAKVTYDVKHPLVLPGKHFVTQLLVRAEHITLLHAGVQLTLTSLRQRFWILDGRNATRGVIRRCTTCFRAKPPSIEQLMGDLPTSRVEPIRPFMRCGVDYGGPILIREARGRGRRVIKSYIVLFVCFTTKAVHIELVYDCTSETFVHALKRFISRRGKPTDLYSDNGTTFVGANKELKVLGELFKSEQFKTGVVEKLSNEHINWHFIPPNAPHIGGLWEAGIKSAKHHLKRIMGNTLFTYDEMCTVLTQIEACLNSRPITVLSNDPNDPVPLSPGHFIIGSPLTAIPEPDLLSCKEQRLSRWQRTQQMVQHFWTRWSKEYLTQLHQRTKWKDVNLLSSLVGKIVLIREDNVPPLSWRLGRITETHPGTDQLVRVVSIKTRNGILKRPITKISILPIFEDGEEEELKK